MMYTHRIENNRDVGVIAQGSGEVVKSRKSSRMQEFKTLRKAIQETRVSIVHCIIRNNAYGVWGLVCVCVCVYVCMYVCIHVCIYVSVCVAFKAWRKAIQETRVSIVHCIIRNNAYGVWGQVCVCVCMYVYVFMCVCMYVCVCVCSI